jgi:hypothetical protein
MKVQIRQVPQPVPKPVIQLSLNEDNGRQATIVAHRDGISGGNYLAWVNNNGEFVINDAAIDRLGLVKRSYNTKKEF